MARVTFDHVSKRYDRVVAVNDFTLEVPDGEFLVLVGPSGSGKSTLLRLVAGLETVTEGTIYIGERPVNNIPARDRNIAMVFQSYALYPHMSVYDNMAFGLRLRKVPKQEVQQRVQKAARLLGIEELLGRKPRQLSGGQRQRVALGRALVRNPAVFLLDEPLSNLDAKLRVQTRAELSRLHRRLGTTFIYVTHDQVEAMTMATKIAVLNEGILQQVGTPSDLYERPHNLFVAGFIGSPAMNFFEATVTGSPASMSLAGAAGRLPVPVGRQRDLTPYLGRRIIFGLRPEHIHDPEYRPAGIDTALVQTTVDVAESLGNEVIAHLLVGDIPLLARLDPRTKARPGRQIPVLFDLARLHAFDPETQCAIGAPPAG